ncbi:MAG: hypothetical protein EOL88_10820 [Bacteroidia bacterium]|nr:hypothetical protein [Bacteroidia bacterium]
MNDPALLGQWLINLAYLAGFILTLKRLNQGRTPPVQEEMYKKYATKKDLENLETRFLAECKATNERIETTNVENNRMFHEIMRSLGRLEGDET